MTNILKKISKENNKSSIIVYFTLRALVILCMILQFIRGDLNNALLCLLALILLIAPAIIQKRYKIKLTNFFEIAIYLFIFSAEILGEINNFYHIIPFWDTLLHTLNGFLSAAVGFSTIELLNKNSININLSPFYMCLVAFCFSMTIGVLWEFFEYGADRFLNFDMQKDEIVTQITSTNFAENKKDYVTKKDIAKTVLYDKNNQEIYTIDEGYLDIGLHDTMGDLFVNFLGAIVFCILGYFDLKDKSTKEFLQKVIPRKAR